MKGMQIDVFIDLRNTAYTITADVEVGAKGNGVIVCQGGRFGGLSFILEMVNLPLPTTSWVWNQLTLLLLKH